MFGLQFETERIKREKKQRKNNRSDKFTVKISLKPLVCCFRNNGCKENVLGPASLVGFRENAQKAKGDIQTTEGKNERPMWKEINVGRKETERKRNEKENNARDKR